MKKKLSAAALFILVFMPFLSFAQKSEDNDEPNGIAEYEYKANGAGDQFLKIAIMPNFPLNFGEQLYIGGAAQLGYYRFLNNWLAVGGELMAGYNPTLGSNVRFHSVQCCNRPYGDLNFRLRLRQDLRLKPAKTKNIFPALH